MKGERISGARLIKFRQTWAFIVGKFMTDPIWWFFLFWLPAFLSGENARKTQEFMAANPGFSGDPASIPGIIRWDWAVAVVYSVATLGSIFGGWLPKAFINGEGPGWVVLGEADFAPVNCDPDTWSWKDGVTYCTGQPVGVIKTVKQYTNFELVAEWCHRKSGGNSGIFVWSAPDALVDVPRGTLPRCGIEVQVLINFAPKDGWATSHGDVFSIHGAKCTPDRPHPRGIERCLPSENRVKGAGEWNHYKVIANDGVLKLHVNGKEVSGVSKCNPRKGYLALESEGAECHFRNIKIKRDPACALCGPQATITDIRTSG